MLVKRGPAFFWKVPENLYFQSKAMVIDQWLIVKWSMMKLVATFAKNPCFANFLKIVKKTN